MAKAQARKSAAKKSTRGRTRRGDLQKIKRPLAKGRVGKTTRPSSKKRAELLVTTNHDRIRKWVETRGGRPATRLPSRRKSQSMTGPLHIAIVGDTRSRSYTDPSYETLTWDDFFTRFDEDGMSFAYLDTTPTGRRSNFYKFTRRAPGRGRRAA